MKLFESAFMNMKDFKYYERYTEDNVVKVREIDNHYEYFEPDSKGDYVCITDPEIKLRKVHGKNRDTEGKFGVTGPIYKHIRDFYWHDEGKDKLIKCDDQYNMHPNLWYLDIETRALTKPDPVNTPNEVVLIQIYDVKLKKMIVLGLKDYTPFDDYPNGCEVLYKKVNSEIELLQTYTALVKKLKPLMVLAWNGEGFDFPYLYNRMKLLGLEPDMAPFGPMGIQENPGIITTWTIKGGGIYYLDMMEVYKTFVKAPRPRYSLDVISEIELKDHKIVHDEYADFDSAYTGLNYVMRDEPYDDRVREEIRQLRKVINEKNLAEDSPEYVKYKELVNFMFVYYGIKDVYLLKRLDDKLQLTNILLGISSMMGILPSDAMGTVKPWSVYISNVAYFENKAMPMRQDWPNPHVVGGFVRDPVRGKHRDIMNFDVNSMYPQLSIAAFNMSPDTFVPVAKAPPELRDIILKYFNTQDEVKVLDTPKEVMETTTELLQKYNLSMGINGALYKRDFFGIVPRLVNMIYDNRKKDKKAMIKYENQKVLIGSILSKREDCSITIEN